MVSQSVTPPTRPQSPCQELSWPLHTVLPLQPEEEVLMSGAIRTVGVVGATLLSGLLKESDVSGRKLPVFLMLTSASLLHP